MSISQSVPVTAASLADTGVYRCKSGETPKLTQYNYHEWRRDMEFFLQAEESLGIALGDEARPEGARPAITAEFNRRAGKAAAMINASCSPSVKTHIDGMRDPHQMWDILKNKLDGAGTRSGHTAILRRFNQLRPVDKAPIAEYISTLSACRKELDGTEQSFSDEIFITHLLTTLSTTFNSIVDIITHQPAADQTIDYVISTLISWDNGQRDRKAEVGSGTNTATTMTSANALAAQTSNRSSRGRYRGRRRGTRGNANRGPSDRSVTCWYCTCPGHKQEECRTKKSAEEARKTRLKNRKVSDSTPSESTNAAFASVHALTVTTTIKIPHEKTGTDWIIDSGASHHLCCDKRQFSTLKHLQKPIQVHLGDNSVILATAIGTIIVALASRTISVEALFVPRLRTSLLSVSFLSRDYSVKFENGICYIGHHGTDPRLPIGRLHHGVFQLELTSARALTTSVPTYEL
jgi:hypothetical protein